jgi:hypothetical protein
MRNLTWGGRAGRNYSGKPLPGGDAYALPRPTIRKWPACEQDGWEMAIVATKVLDARDVYRARLNGGALFVAIIDMHHAPPASSH